jgi:zinc D-Ala-D-Ala dipeptidase
MRFLSLLAFCCAAATACGVDLSKAIPSHCGQVVLVTARDWPASTGMLRRFERTEPRARWEEIGKPVEVLLGGRGLAWGVGLHAMVADDVPRKVEGDLRAPAGVFEFGSAFGFAARKEMPWLRMPYLRLSPTTEAVDDPASRDYGQIVDRARVGMVDWKSSEHMGRIPAYELGLVIAHNPQHVSGAGSCIFLHLWLDERDGTSGCTALHRADLMKLMRWLDPEKRPVLVQLPAKIARENFGGF